jgi:hypothetical protein
MGKTSRQIPAISQGATRVAKLIVDETAEVYN